MVQLICHNRWVANHTPCQLCLNIHVGVKHAPTLSSVYLIPSSLPSLEIPNASNLHEFHVSLERTYKRTSIPSTSYLQLPNFRRIHLHVNFQTNVNSFYVVTSLPNSHRIHLHVNFQTNVNSFYVVTSLPNSHRIHLHVNFQTNVNSFYVVTSLPNSHRIHLHVNFQTNVNSFYVVN